MMVMVMTTTLTTTVNRNKINIMFPVASPNRLILDASAKSLDASAKYFGLVGGILVASAAQDWSPRQGYRFGDEYFGRLGFMTCP